MRGKPFRFSLATDLLANVSPGTPPSNVLLAAWAALVMRQLDVEQVIVMARDGPGDRTVVRMALRIDANDSLGDLAGRVSAAAQTDERADDRRVIRLGLADRGFTTDGYSPGDDQVPVLTWWLNGQRVEAEIFCDPAHFDRGRVEGMAEQLPRLLQAAVANPDAPVTSFSMLTADQEQDLARWNATDHPQTPSGR